jgi:chromosome segregation ATPase
LLLSTSFSPTNPTKRDAKETLLNQISQLQEQQDLVQSRFDSISQTADNAMMREREAEEKLDMALTMHARQIAQRQSREAELERIISELSSSLATTSTNPGSEGDSAAGAENINVLKSQIYSLEEDLETYKTRLEAERQRVMIMQQELRDMSKERTHEINSARAKQHQFDRQMADMSLQISKLQSSLREAQRSSSNAHDNSFGNVDSVSRVKELTQELVRNQEKMGQVTSELSTVRNRLQVAIARAEKAENALARVETADIESGTESGNFQGFGVRRRKKELPSIRDAINLPNSQNQNIERVAKVIDGLDRFSVETGKFLRHNPLARGGFILYLLILHLWTFAVLFLHAHRFEDVHGDFGAGRNLAHSPYALMQNSPSVQETKIEQALQTSDSRLADGIIEEKLSSSALTNNLTTSGSV